MVSVDTRVRLLEQRMKANRLSKHSHRILFLDFDGVVNVPYEFGTPEYNAAMDNGIYDFFRPEIVVRLNTLIHEYDLHVVISSSWRFSGAEFCQNSLKNAGFSDDVVIEGMTPLSEGVPPRFEEILIYLEQHPDVSEFLILDDIPMHDLSAYAVQTEFEVGYTEESDQKARKILDRQISDNKPDRSVIIFIFVILAFLVIFVLSAVQTVR